MRSSKSIVVITALLLLGSVVGPAVVAAAETGDLAVDVTQANESVTVTVTNNSTAVQDASVNVTAINATFAGEGSYTTDANGTVTFAAPNETLIVTIEATNDNMTATTTAELTGTNASDVPFGQRVSAFVHALQMTSTSDEPLGQLVSEFVTANNPGSEHRPDHAGPKFDAEDESELDDENETELQNATKGPAKDDDRRGPPEDRGNDKDKDDKRGPPEDRGNDKDKDDKRGPPEDRGN